MTLRKEPTIRRRPTSDEVRVARLQRALRQVDSAKARRRYIPGPVNIVDLRRHLGMSQIRFAMRFGFPVATLRHWERGDRKPRGAALVLLNVIERNPRMVLLALRPRLKTWLPGDKPLHLL